MNTKLIAGGALSGLILTGVALGSVSAQSAADATGLTQEQAIQIALLEMPGAVQQIEREREDGADVYQIEILNADGQIFEVEIAVATGAVLEVEAEDED